MPAARSYEPYVWITSSRPTGSARNPTQAWSFTTKDSVSWVVSLLPFESETSVGLSKRHASYGSTSITESLEERARSQVNIGPKSYRVFVQQRPFHSLINGPVANGRPPLPHTRVLLKNREERTHTQHAPYSAHIGCIQPILSTTHHPHQVLAAGSLLDAERERETDRALLRLPV